MKSDAMESEAMEMNGKGISGRLGVQPKTRNVERSAPWSEIDRGMGNREKEKTAKRSQTRPSFDCNTKYAAAPQKSPGSEPSGRNC
jgi:hypothetical protein